MVKHIFVIMVSLSLLTACVTAHDPSLFKRDEATMATIPHVCKSKYEISDIKVAIAPFANNTTFSNAEIAEQTSKDANQSISRNTGEISAEYTENNSPHQRKKHGRIKAKSKAVTRSEYTSSSTDIVRKVNDNLANSFEESLTNEIRKIGGIKVYSRSDLPKILNEQKFQNSGLVDEKSIAKLGKIAGVKYIVTGSINNAALSYLRCEENPPKKSDNAWINAAALTAHLACKAIEGWSVNTSASIRMVDVETAEVVFSQIVEGKDRFGQANIANPSYDSIIASIKKAGGKAIKDIKPTLSKSCSVKGYIKETRTSMDGRERSALINIGTKRGMAPTSKLAVYYFEESKDPIDNTVSCNMIKLPAYLEVTDQLQQDQCWAMIKGNADAAKRIKVGQLIETSDISAGQSIVDMMGF